MNLLVVGASHRTAPVGVLGRLAVGPDETPRMLTQLLSQPYLAEAVVLSTCNRVEVYAAVSAFHGGLTDVCAVLAQRAGCAPVDLAEHLYVHYDAAAVDHIFRVAGGLDSMVVGEAQILGQLRDAYHTAAGVEAVGRLTHELLQQALRVGKRVHAETDIDRAGRSVVSAALEVAAAALRAGPAGPGGAADHSAVAAPSGGRAPAAPEGTVSVTEGAGSSREGVGSSREGADPQLLAGRSALVIGAGAMGALSLATLSRCGAGPLAVTNRGADRAGRLAEAYRATLVPFADMATALAGADLVITATASPTPVLTVAEVTAALRRRPPGGDPLVVLDLAVPRDVEPAVGELPGVFLLDIDRLATATRSPASSGVRASVAEAERIVLSEVESFLSWLRGAEVGPTVAALRARADDVVAVELRRLAQRRPDLTDDQRAEVAHTVHRVVQRLLHSPTVRVRQLAAEPGGDQYTALLRELFDLDVPQPDRADRVPGIDPGPDGPARDRNSAPGRDLIGAAGAGALSAGAAGAGALSTGAAMLPGEPDRPSQTTDDEPTGADR